MVGGWIEAAFAPSKANGWSTLRILRCPDADPEEIEGPARTSPKAEAKSCILGSDCGAGLALRLVTDLEKPSGGAITRCRLAVRALWDGYRVRVPLSAEQWSAPLLPLKRRDVDE